MDSGLRQIFDFPGKAKSDVWSHFGFYLTDDGYNLDKARAICKYCRIGVRYTGNTTNLHTHFINHHLKKHPINHVKQESSEEDPITCGIPGPETVADIAHMPPSISASYIFPPKAQGKMTPQAYAIMEYIIEDMLPFSTTQSQSFQNLVRVLNPKCEVPSRKYLEDVFVKQLYDESRTHVLTSLEGQEAVTLSTDVWTTSETHMTVSVHFISRTWHLNTFVLQTVTLPDDVTSKHIFNVLKTMAAEWNITCEPTLVLGRESVLRPGDDLEWRNLDCFAQSINSAAKKGLAVNSVQNVIVACKKLSQYFRCRLSLDKLNPAFASDALSVGNDEQWNSTFVMLERFVQHYPSIEKSFEDSPLENNGAPSLLLDAEELRLCTDLVTLLKPLHNASMLLCDQKTVTASMVLPVLKKLEITLLNGEWECPIIKECRSIIWKEIQAPYSSENIRDFLLVCSLLDPRYKELRYIEAVEREKARRLLYDAALKPFLSDFQVKQEVDSDDEYIQNIILGPPFSVSSDADSQPAGACTGEPAKKKKKTTQLATNDWLSDVVGHSDDLSCNKMSPVEMVSSEIGRFMAEKQITSSSPLVWWYEREKIFPNLSCLAKKHMCVMATSTSPEDVFLAEYESTRARRSCIPDHQIDMMLFLSKNHRSLKKAVW